LTDQRKPIRIINAALDEWEGDLVLRGSIAPESLPDLDIAEYQREVLSPAKIDRLKVAHLARVRFPDVELSNRGLSYKERGGVFFLADGVFVVDGQQRIVSAIQAMDERPDVLPHLGAVIHFGHDEAWERKRFEVLNLTQTKVSSNVTLRNLRHEVTVAQVIYRLSTADKSFVLYGKVTYGQNPAKSDLLSAVMLFKTIGMLHSHIGPGRANNAKELTAGLEQIMTTTGRNTFINNVRLFFEVIDDAWGVQRVAYRRTAAHLKATFLTALARLFSEHEDFWAEETLQVSAPIIRKLAKFPMDDPTVMALASSGGKATDHLFHLLVEHVNSGKRTKHLKRRNGVVTVSDEEFEDE